ncbi:uncharacterized protein N7503_004623 [Penicillium pulvis]|uniref:uncharacterized protein n=1 Tax=Penicillium pulvis TaxID=1562058 RepID=UPI002548C296|nr:uncharacterized protein N7503_004623 [Penicillium pulvis]KAJ5802173.1 hypothetical protein N7503_004623 [Penicillium pulvis]
MSRIPPFDSNSFFSKPDTSHASKAAEHQETTDAWVHNTKPPLFWEFISAHPISLKLENMKAALSAGADPNEMDHERDPRRSLGRPLHCAMGDWGDPVHVKENIPAIKLLLEHGADPRLPGPEVKPASLGLQSPLEYARRLAMREWRGKGELLDCGYYAEAYRVMKEAADDLDWRDAPTKGGVVDSVLGIFGVR